MKNLFFKNKDSRLITAAIALPLLILPIYFELSLVFLIFLLLCVIMSNIEFYKILAKIGNFNIDFWQDLDNKHKEKKLAINLIYVVSLSSVFFLLLVFLQKTILYYFLTAFIIFCYISSIFFFRKISLKNSTILLSILHFCFIYGVLPWFFVWQIYNFQQGNLWIIYMISVVTGTDTGGYFFGKYLGKTKLTKTISPNKTWEGAVGAIIMSLIFSMVVCVIFNLTNIYTLIIFSVTLSVFAMIGDLIESNFKRSVNIKDSGGFFPGHGGFLDRADGFILAAPVLWFMLEVFKNNHWL